MDKTNKGIILSGIVLDDAYVFTLEEVKAKLNIEDALLEEMLEHGLLESKIDLTGLRRLQIAVNLHHDLGVNLAGAALALELLDELNELRVQLSIMDKHFK